MFFLYDNVAVLSVAAVCCVLAWLFGGTVASALFPAIPWLVAIMAEMALCFPQRKPGETTFEARERVWAKIKSDRMPMFALAFVALLCFAFFNKGLCPCCDYPAINFDGAVADPPLPVAPFCVDRLEHLNVTLWFVCAFSCAIAARHALLKRGKRLVLEIVVWNGLALSVLGMVQYATGAEGPFWIANGRTPTYFFSTFGYPNMAGDYFTTLFALSVALWRWNVEEVRREQIDSNSAMQSSHKRFWRKHLMLVPAVVFFFSAMMTLSRSAILMVTVLAVLFFAHAFTSFLARMSRAKRVKTMAANFIVLVLIGTFFAVFLSGRDRLVENGAGGFKTDFKSEVSSLDGRGMIDRISGKGQYHVRVASKIWLDNILFGCGGWGYRHFCIPKMSDADFKAMQRTGGVNVHNDYMQFLAEHGIVGLSLIAAVLLSLIWPLFRVWKTLAASARFLKPKDQPPKPVAIFALPASVFCILSAAIATMVHAFADCPFRSPAVMTLFFTMLASMDGFLPRLEKE